MNWPGEATEGSLLDLIFVCEISTSYQHTRAVTESRSCECGFSSLPHHCQFRSAQGADINQEELESMEDDLVDEYPPFEGLDFKPRENSPPTQTSKILF